VGFQKAKRIKRHDVMSHLVVKEFLAKDTSFVQLSCCITLVDIPQEWRAVGVYLVDNEGRYIEQLSYSFSRDITADRPIYIPSLMIKLL
jgi:hypothetical protein